RWAAPAKESSPPENKQMQSESGTLGNNKEREFVFVALTADLVFDFGFAPTVAWVFGTNVNRTLSPDNVAIVFMRISFTAFQRSGSRTGTIQDIFRVSFSCLPRETPLSASF